MAARIVVAEFASLDGVMEAPGGEADYELLALIGESVKVLIATSGGEEAYATFAGTLTRGEDSPIWAVAGRVDEAITFRVGESSYFVLYRRASRTERTRAPMASVASRSLKLSTPSAC